MLLALLAYLPALRAGFIWDDDVVTTSKLLASPGGLLKIWTPPSLAPRESHYWPMVYTTFWLENRLWGAHPLGYHLVNILLHGLCAVLLWRVLKRLEMPGAWLAGALFAVHPVHAESVAWVIERKDVLSGVLALGAALFFLRSQKSEVRSQNPEARIQNPESRIQNPEFSNSQLTTHNSQLVSHNSQLTTHNSQLILALLLFAGALLSKSIVVGLPVGLAAVVWWRKGRPSLREAIVLGLMLAMAAGITVYDLHFLNAHLQEPIPSGLSPVQRVLVASRAAWTYLAKLAWPHPLASFYPKWDVDPADALAWLPVAAWIGAAALLWAARRRLGRGPLAAIVFFLALIAPALGLIDHGFMDYSWVADRFQYLASAGPLALAAAGLYGLRDRLKNKIPVYAGAAIVLLLGAACFYRAGLFKDSYTLYSAAARAYPECWGGHYVRGFAMLERGDDSLEALKSLDAAQQLHPDYMISNLMGQVQIVLHQFPEAEASFKRTLEMKPDFGEGHNSYGLLLGMTGRPAEALAHFREAVRLEPDNAKALINLAGALRDRKEFAAAAEYYEQALKLDPAAPQVHLELGRIYEQTQKPADAGRHYQEVLRLEPANPLAAERLKALGAPVN